MRGGWVERGTVAIRLGRPHFAFFRGYLDGLELGALAARYLAPSLPDAARRGVYRDGDGEPVDLRLARSMVRWIRAQLQVAARRSLGPADARLLGVAPAALLPAPPERLPNLEQFREEQDPDGLFAESELITLFSQTYTTSGTSAEPARRAARNQRLRLRQQRALARLEQLVAADPQLADPVDAWLDAALAARLAAVGVMTLGQLLGLIDRHGYRWYCKVPRIGVKAALQIAGWLQQESVRAALGTGLPAHALMPTRAEYNTTSGTAPLAPAPAGALARVLAQIQDQPALNGTVGKNRGTRCQLSANDDWSAIQAWLAARNLADHTARAYRKESERFFLWAVHECGKPVSSLTVDDCSRYRTFLALLGICPAADWVQQFRLPQETWIGPRGVVRTSRYWRPFHGPMAKASQRQALVIIQSLLQWLQEQGYLHANPLPRAPRRPTGSTGVPLTRALTMNEWRAAREHVPDIASFACEAVSHGLPSHAGAGASVKSVALRGFDPVGRIGTASGQEVGSIAAAKQGAAQGKAPLDKATLETHARLRFIISLAYGTGLRLSEMSQLRRHHLLPFQSHDTASSGWLLNVAGKGGVMRVVPLSNPVMDDLLVYLATRGHDVHRMAPEAPLIAALAPAAPATRGAPSEGVDVPLSPRRIYCVIKRLFTGAAKRVSQASPGQAARLRQASPHWLRNTFATHALAHEMPLDILHGLLGHRCLESTSRYVKTERERRGRAVGFATEVC